MRERLCDGAIEPIYDFCFLDGAHSWEVDGFALLLVERDDRYELTRPLSGAAIPGTLRALLTARLDRLARARQTAQLAAALGREFSLDVLSAASPLGPAAVALDPLRHEVEHLGFQVDRATLGLPGAGHQPGVLEHP